MVNYIIIVILILVTVIVTLIILLKRSYNSVCDKFCVCSGIDKKNCMSQARSRYNYNHGETEYSEFVPQKWHSTNFSSY